MPRPAHAILVTTAEVTDRAGALLAAGVPQENLSAVKAVLADGGYTGEAFAKAVRASIGAEVQIAKRSEQHTFAVIPKRWVVERSFAWLEKCRRLWKNCESLRPDRLLGNSHYRLGWLEDEAEFLGGAVQCVLLALATQGGIAESLGIERPAVLDHRIQNAGEFMRGGGDGRRGCRAWPADAGTNRPTGLRPGPQGVVGLTGTRGRGLGHGGLWHIYGSRRPEG